MAVNMSNKGILAFLAFLVATSAAVCIGSNGGPAAAHVVRVAGHGARMPLVMQRLSPSPFPSIGQPAPEKYPNAPITLNSLHRDSLGFVTLTWTIVYNGDDENFTVPRDLVSIYKYAGTSASAVTLTDEVGKVRYNPLRLEQSGSCICTSMPSIPLGIRNGESAVLNEVYKLPTNISSVTVSIPGYSPAKNIPVK